MRGRSRRCGSRSGRHRACPEGFPGATARDGTHRTAGTECGGRKNPGNAIELFRGRGGDLFGFAGGEGAGPSDPASLQFSMKGGEARRDSAGIRLHVEAVPDSPNGDRKTVRDEDESHVRKWPVTIRWFLANSLIARLDLVRGSGLAESRRTSCIIMLRRDGLSSTRWSATKTNLGTFPRVRKRGRRWRRKRL